MVRLVRCLEVDINSGFKKVVDAEVNESLIELQRNGNKIVEVSKPMVDGRKVYLTVLYENPNMKL